MATALATTAAPVQFDFQNNNVEVMTLDTLRRTHKENDIYGNPLKGIYHYEVIERMADICQKHNLNYEVEEIFAAQNKNKAQPGVVVLPQVEQKYGRWPSRRISCAAFIRPSALRNGKRTS